MAKKLMSWKTKGMNRDLSVSAFNPEFAFENRNLRLGTNEANTTMSWVNEKGTLLISLRNIEYWSKVEAGTQHTIYVYENPNDASWTHHAANTENVPITGTPIGTAVINHQLVVFTTDTLHDHDYIFVLSYIDGTKESMYNKVLFGFENISLGFDIDHPIETLVSYESESIQKVYWTDGKNQPRVVNIAGKIKRNNSTQFDFVPTLQLQEDVKVKKLLGANGLFAPGVIQYALTYYTKYGQESNIFYTSPLLYISYKDRGASPEDKVENAFKITVNRVDTNFDYLRIYSIQRTSINATPICKRVQDIEIKNLSYSLETGYQASFIDAGTSGESIDPTELLYKGGEVISASTMEQKDNTIFLGDLKITRPQIDAELKTSLKAHTALNINRGTRAIKATSISDGSYVYANQLTAFNSDYSKSVPCAGFKYGDCYRLGVQFQYKTGKWSDPIWIIDDTMNRIPSQDNDNITINLPVFSGVLDAADVVTLVNAGYKRVRGVVVFPTLQDRNVLCQGVINPTLYTGTHRNNDGDLYAQASWFFRASNGGTIESDKSVSPVSPLNGGTLAYTHRGIAAGSPESGCTKYDPEDTANSGANNIRKVEIQGDYENNDKFKTDYAFVTFNSPDIEFDTQLSLTDYSSTKYRQLGFVNFSGTLSDISIQTETPTVSSLGSGFVHKSFVESGTSGIVAGLFYDDTVVDDNGEHNIERIEAYDKQFNSAKWMVYPWHKSGSLNNDINRPSNKGTQTAILKKKVISNLRYANTSYSSATEQLPSVEWENITTTFYKKPQMFSSDEATILKYGSSVYMGNIDTVLTANNGDGNYFAFESNNIDTTYVRTDFKSTNWWKTFSLNPTQEDNQGLYKYLNGAWDYDGYDIGDGYLDLVIKKASVRMKYKSTPHLVFEGSAYSGFNWSNGSYKSLPVIEVIQNTDSATRFGGTSNDALQENIWLPAGEPKLLTDVNENQEVEFKWEYGDTYFQRWDCLKTYAFTNEDPNQIVEIGSFMLETHTNIDGRYDRNRGQMNNLNMSPRNFNLLNPVYSQQDNFFQYRIMDDFHYTNNVFPNQITWSKTKESGAEVDLWTNMTLASTLEMDGDKGSVTSIKRFDNQLICFQNSGISQILYNENVQIQATNGVPIEIANSGKVQGKRYYSETIGCSNKWSIIAGAAGLYFMDSDSKSIFLFNGQLSNLSDAKGFNAWSKMYIPSGDVYWTPSFPDRENRTAFISFYDKMNQEVLFINRNVCLAFSERFGVFTSFYDYNGTPFFENLDDTGLWLRANTIWKHQAGDYCKFFGAPRPYSMVLVGNPEPQIDKTFTNLEFRACVDGDGTETSGKFTPYLPFDSLDTWNEYQHGMAYLNNMTGHSAFKHHTLDNEASLKRKFRIWKCDIPRDNGENVDTFNETFDETFHPLARTREHPLDRMRNPWLYLRLRKEKDANMQRTEIHDLIMTYFS